MAKQGEHGITWTEETWNPIRGCTRVSEGCRFCYAERQAARFSGPGQPYEGLVRQTSQGPLWTGKIRLVEEHLNDPLRWQKPRRVFVNSMSDLFHEGLGAEDIAGIFGVMALAWRHQFQVLTKRPQRMQTLLSGYYFPRFLQNTVSNPNNQFAKRPSDLPVWPLPNVWLGTSIEDQATADERIPLLLQTPAAVRWISAEPLLGPVDLSAFITPPPGRWITLEDGADVFDSSGPGLNWVVVGGESGPGARPMHPQWARDLREQCQQAGVPFHFKQWGEWAPMEGEPLLNDPLALLLGSDGMKRGIADGSLTNALGKRDGNLDTWMRRVGKKAAGRLLDGRTWDEFPEGSAE